MDTKEFIKELTELNNRTKEEYWWYNGDVRTHVRDSSKKHLIRA